MLFRDQVEKLARVIYGRYLQKEEFCGIGFDRYECLGDLQGSALLQHQGCLAEASRVLADKAVCHNVRYLEIRCSPYNYTRDGLTENQVIETIQQAFLQYRPELETMLIFIASRHNDIESIKDHVDLAVNMTDRERCGPDIPVRGLDLAGSEEACPASDMQQYLMPALKRCMHFTIHAGESLAAESIWEAVYYLNAERIGHGLSLKENPDLMEKFKDRNIVLEMCPSSNFQIKGFQDYTIPSTCHLPDYPLQYYLEKGLKVTVNTDNPGISLTDFTRELYKACSMTDGGLSVWEILSILRNSFKASFSEKNVKYDILKKAEAEIVNKLPRMVKYMN